MFRCPVCGAISQRAGTCGVCGGVVREIQDNPVRDPNTQRFWTRTKIMALSALIIISITSIGTGLYLTARSDPSCKNGAINYPSCNNCGSLAAYAPSTDTCSCTDYVTVNINASSKYEVYALNPPACNKFCANNAVNPPTCDRCADNQTDITCPPSNSKPAVGPEDRFLAGQSKLTHAVTILRENSYDFTPISANATSKV